LEEVTVIFSWGFGYFSNLTEWPREPRAVLGPRWNRIDGAVELWCPQSPGATLPAWILKGPPVFGRSEHRQDGTRRAAGESYLDDARRAAQSKGDYGVLQFCCKCAQSRR